MGFARSLRWCVRLDEPAAGILPAQREVGALAVVIATRLGSWLAGQASSGIARSRVSACVKLLRQGQRAGRCRVWRRALRVIRPGSVR
jgi:hypothetical protein